MPWYLAGRSHGTNGHSFERISAPTSSSSLLFYLLMMPAVTGKTELRFVDQFMAS
jgi:hypothetical protein